MAMAIPNRMSLDTVPLNQSVFLLPLARQPRFGLGRWTGQRPCPVSPWLRLGCIVLKHTRSRNYKSQPFDVVWLDTTVLTSSLT